MDLSFLEVSPTGIRILIQDLKNQLTESEKELVRLRIADALVLALDEINDNRFEDND